MQFTVLPGYVETSLKIWVLTAQAAMHACNRNGSLPLGLHNINK